MTYRAAPTPATALGVLLAVWSWTLGSLLLVRAVGWPVSFPAFLAYLSGASLLGLGFVFAYWAYAGLALRYVVEGDTLTIKVGPTQQVIPLSQVEQVVPGHTLPPPRMQGVNWWGLHFGRARLGLAGDAIVYSTHHRREQLLYLVTPTAIFAVSPQQPTRFIRAVQLRPQAESRRDLWPQRQRLTPTPPTFWRDRPGRALALLGLGLNLALFGFVFTAMPGLADQMDSKGDVLEPALAGLTVLAVNTALALVLHGRERAAVYLPLTASVTLQVLLWVATVAAVA